MEIIIILVVLVVVSIVVFSQLKGAKPEVASVLEASAQVKSKTKKTSPKKTIAKTNQEKWDEAEVSPKDESPRTKKDRRKIFDPVKSGEDVVRQATTATETLRKREATKEVDEDEAEVKKSRKKLQSDGFVIVDDRKKVQKKKEEVAAPVEKSADEMDENDLIMEMLKAVKEGTYRGKKDGTGEKKERATLADAKQLSQDEVEKKIKASRDEARNATTRAPPVCKKKR